MMVLWKGMRTLDEDGVAMHVFTWMGLYSLYQIHIYILSELTLFKDCLSFIIYVELHTITNNLKYQYTSIYPYTFTYVITEP